MRWNVVIGGQLFSKSLLGYTTYKMGFATREGLLPAIIIMLLPFAILAVLVRLLPPWGEAHPAEDLEHTPWARSNSCFSRCGQPVTFCGKHIHPDVMAYPRTS